VIRITIEIDGKEVSSTTVPPAVSRAEPPAELLARAETLGALNAGGAPSEFVSSITVVAAPVAVDAGPSREHNGSGASRP